MNLVDSCGWLEYFADGGNASFFAPAIEDMDQLIVPSLCLFEVFKRVLQQRSEQDALRAAAVMRQAQVVDLKSEAQWPETRFGLGDPDDVDCLVAADDLAGRPGLR